MLTKIRKLNKYSFEKRFNMRFGAVMLMFTILVRFMNISTSHFDASNVGVQYVSSDMFTLVCFLFIFNVQNYIGLSAGQLVVASPLRKKMQTIYFTLISNISVFTGIIFIFLMDQIIMYMHPEQEATCAKGLFYSILFVEMIGVISTVLHKSILGYFILALAGMSVFFLWDFGKEMSVVSLRYNKVFLISIVILIVAAVLQYAVMLLLHKLPLSKRLVRQMQKEK